MTTMSTLTPFQETREALFGFVSNTLGLGPEHILTTESGSEVLAVTGLGPNGSEGLALEAQDENGVFVLTLLQKHGEDVSVEPMIGTNDTQGLGLLFCALCVGDFDTANMILTIMAHRAETG